MSFGAGGGGPLPNHEHTNIALDGGPLDFINTTIASLSQGSVTYSDGAALQELISPAVPAGEVLTFPAAATAPSWQAAGGGSVWELIDYTRVGATTTTIDTTFANIDVDDMVELYCVSAGCNGGNDIGVQIYDETSTLLTTADYTNHGYTIISGVQTIINTTAQTEWNVKPASFEPHMLTMHISLGRCGGSGSPYFPRIQTFASGISGVSHIGGTYNVAPITGISGIKFGVSGANVIENGSYLSIYLLKPA